ncbi:glutamate-cysteine ligase family protein [Nocardioides sp.]|uniref:glutamate-cysteine ligase family protein n=1 Tax=Nocardioides sp. TaxID=35761 RepID=UPI0031FEF390|nr:glutamate--cysteine ligase [Nocardioides sp.]
MDVATIRSRVARVFPGRDNRRTTRIGVEQELIARQSLDDGPVAPDVVRAAARQASYLPSLGFEPGGQVELSLPPANSPTELVRRVRHDLAALRADCARSGVTLESTPLDRRNIGQVPLQLRSARYLAMQRHFDTIGPAGRRMMRLTASTQVCLDWWPGRAGLEQWRVLQLSAPFLAAHFACATGPTSRLATWLEVDPSRSAFDDRLLRGDDPVATYAGFAAGAGVFTTPGDVAEHLTTLFAPVRPRRHYLEVRYLDAQPVERLPQVFSVLAALAHDDGCRRRALSMLEPECSRLGEHWSAAALGAPGPAARGRELVDLVAESSRRLGRVSHCPDLLLAGVA